MKRKIIINGNNLTIEDVGLFCDSRDVRVDIAPSALSAIQKTRKFIEQELDKRIIYGVNTGFGPMASHIITPRKLIELQENLIRSHAVGMGKPIDTMYVLAAMIVRLNTLAKGFSGVSKELIDSLQKFNNHRVIPVIPEHGGVGASGDLVQLAHIALALMGEGKIFYRGKLQPAKDVLRRLKLKPYKLKPKEGLSLINGTSVMTGIAALNCLYSRKLLDLAIRTAAFSLEIVHAHDDSISEKLQDVRPHRGQIAVAKKMREILDSSGLLKKRETSYRKLKTLSGVHKISEVVQEIYSFRCVPQILGPVYDTLENVWQDVETEINSATDNPIVDLQNKELLHGGNFHGDYISSAMDKLKASLTRLTMLSERRINFFLNHKINQFFPPFLNLNEPGLTLALQGLQFVATSTTAQNQTLSFPHYVHSIPTNGDNQDIVSMGTDAALFAARVVENAYIVLAIELVALAQAADFLKAQNDLSDSSKKLYKKTRAILPKITKDRVVINELTELVKNIL